MINFLIGAGLIALATKVFSSSKKNKVLFISFAKEDSKYRDFLVEQEKKGNSPFKFIDNSVKEPWEEEIWKRECREQIRNSDGVIVLLSKKTYHASGCRWEMKCAKEENIPIMGMHVQKNNQGSIPPELKGENVIIWQWEELQEAINTL